jgi:hypothetical protein
MTLSLAPEKVGPWIVHELLTSPQMNKVASELVKAIDGSGGGAYNPSAHITLGGAGEFRIDNVLRVRTGADFFLDAGATATFNDGVVFNDQADFAGNVDFFASVDFRAGGTTTIVPTHQFLIKDLTDMQVDADGHTYRMTLAEGVANEDGLGVAHWNFGGAAVADPGKWIQPSASAFAFIFFPVRVLEGDSITAVTLWLTGGAGAGHGGVLPGTLPRLRLLEQAPIFGAYASLASTTDPSPSAAVYDSAHGFGFSSGLPVVAQNGNYLLEVRGENGTGATNELRIDGIEVTITRRQLVSTNIL